MNRATVDDAKVDEATVFPSWPDWSTLRSRRRSVATCPQRRAPANGHARAGIGVPYLAQNHLAQTQLPWPDQPSQVGPIFWKWDTLNRITDRSD